MSDSAPDRPIPKVRKGSAQSSANAAMRASSSGITSASSFALVALRTRGMAPTTGKASLPTAFWLLAGLLVLVPLCAARLTR